MCQVPPGNGDGDGVPGLLTLADWFGCGLRAAPDGTAIRIGARDLSYAELHATALRLAGAMIASCGGPPRAAGVLAARSVEAYAGILAACYAGARVVPLSPAFPAGRTAAMAAAAGVDVIVADRQAQPALPALAQALPGVPVLSLDAGLAVPAEAAGSAVTEIGALPAPAPARPADPAYVLFTSGSTGRPKAVPVTHASMAHFIDINLRRYSLSPADVCSQTFDTTFDLAMFDLFVTWAAGAMLVSTPPQAFLQLPEFARRNGLTLWFSVPSAIALLRRRGALAPGALAGLRWSLFCGEPLTAGDARDWQRAAPGSAVENLYGPTELTIACTAYRWDERVSPGQCVNGLVPIGELYPGLSARLLGDDGQARDDEGELCVRGPQMFDGYLDPADDAGRFVTLDAARYYRTGDLVRRAGSAGYAYLGRADGQVKIRGYRVELAELEWHARSVAGVEDAVVVPVEDRSSRRLFAWYTGEPEAGDRLGAELRGALPEFMVPHWTRRLDHFPLNANRKVDRKALTAMAQELIGDARRA